MMGLSRHNRRRRRADKAVVVPAPPTRRSPSSRRALDALTFPMFCAGLARPVAALWYRGGLAGGGGSAAGGDRRFAGHQYRRCDGAGVTQRSQPERWRARATSLSPAARWESTRPRIEARSRRVAVTFAVLGCGVDVVYPERHAKLFDEIAVAGGLLSEHAPGVPPKKGGTSRWRNRIVAALAEAVVVVEAPAIVGSADHRAPRARGGGQMPMSGNRAAPAPTSSWRRAGRQRRAETGEEVLRRGWRAR